MSGLAVSPRWARVVGAVVVAGAVAAGFYPFTYREYTETDLYAVAGARMRAGEEIYRVDERPFTYPPLLAVPCVPLSYLPPLGARLVWYLSVCGTLAAVVYLVMRRVWDAADANPVRSRAVFWWLVLVLAGRHLLAPVENQSHDLLIFLAALLAIDAWSRASDAAAGAWAGAAAALKATPLLLLPLFVWQRYWRAAGVMLVTGVALTLATDALWPRQDGRLWVVAWFQTFLSRAAPGDPATMPTWNPWCPLNQSLTGTTKRLLSPMPPGWAESNGWADASVLDVGPAAVRAVTLVGLAAVFGWMLWVTRPSLTVGLTDRRRRFLRLGQGGVLLIAMILLSPTSIKTHFGVLLLPVAVCVADYLWHGRDRVTGGLLLLVFVAGTLTTKDFLGRTAGTFIMAAGSLTLVAVALLAATGRVVLLRSREWQAEIATPAVEPAVRRAA
jgi:hypothetical protein